MNLFGCFGLLQQDVYNSFFHGFHKKKKLNSFCSWASGKWHKEYGRSFVSIFAKSNSLSIISSLQEVKKYSPLPRLQYFTILFKNEKKSMWEGKKISRFLSTGHGILPSCGNARETLVAKCELVLLRTSPVD